MSKEHVIRDILLNHWDPHNAANRPEAHRTYDACIEPLMQLLQSSANEEAIIHFLKEREAESMCFPVIGVSHLKLVAKKLLELES